MKTTLNSASLTEGEPKGYLLVKGGTRVLYGAVRQILARGSTRELRKRDYGCFFAAVLAAAPVFWTRVCPLAPLSLVPIYTP